MGAVALNSTLTLRERLSYGFGNFGINLLFGVTGAYLMYFYTDVYHVNAATVAGLFLLARGADAVFDPLFGLLIDRTDTRWGKHRPYLVLLALPFVLCGVAVFSTPALHGESKTAYIAVTYTLLGMLYSGLSLPLNSMLPTLTRDPRARNTTNALRELMGTGAVVGVGYIMLPLVHALGASEAQGFQRAVALMGLVTLVALLVAFANTRERVAPVVSPQVLNTRQSLLATRGNWPWIATMLVNFCFWIGFIAHVQSVVYYARDVLAQPGLVGPLMATMAALLVGTAASGWTANRIGKIGTGLIGAGVGALATAAIPLSKLAVWQLATNAMGYAGLGLIGGLMFALMADAVDYGEWRSGFRAQGFLFAASSFGVKLGMSIGGAAGAWMLARAGYVAGQPVTAAVAMAVGVGHVWIPVLSYVAMGASLLLFRFHPDYARGAAHHA